MVKLLTSVAAMQLVERGRLKLEEPADNIDPVLAAPRFSPASMLKACRNSVRRKNTLRCAIC